MVCSSPASSLLCGLSCLSFFVHLDHGKEGNAAIHTSEALEETMEQKARGIVREFLKKRGLGLEEFRGLRKGHADKVLLAGELRRRTKMTMEWIARELNAGVPQTLWRALWSKREEAIIRGTDPFSRKAIMVEKERSDNTRD